MSDSKASQSISLPQLQNLIKRDPESYRDEVRIFSHVLVKLRLTWLTRPQGTVLVFQPAPQKSRMGR